MNHPLISICIPTYNGDKFLNTCIDSAINQSYRNIEIIMVDDGSIDNTYDIIRHYAAKDERIKIFRNEKNLGLVGNWNRCLEVSSGEWIKFLFQDDYLAPECIEVMVKTIEANDKIITSARRLIIEESVSPSAREYSLTKTLTFEKLGILSGEVVSISPGKISLLAARHISINFIGEPTVVMFKKDVINTVGTFNADLVQICDLEYFLRIATAFGVKYIPQQITYFRAGAHAHSASGRNIAQKKYSVNYIDPIITVHQLLYAKVFSRFRELLPFATKIKLKLFFLFRVHEAYSIAFLSSIEEQQKFEYAASQYPAINTFKKGSLLTTIFGKIVKTRRRIKQ